MNKDLKKIIWTVLPRCTFVNKLLAVPYFKRSHGRSPLDPFSPKATFEDYVFHRMIRPWTPFHETCVDKEYAKVIACALAPNLKTADTMAVMPITSKTTVEAVGKFLYPFLGKPFVAKSTHTSGDILFLDRPLSTVLSQTLELFKKANQNYFFTRFEEQYRRLPFKLLVETSLGPEPPPDFRFYSSRGEVLFCQFDQGRFTEHRQALFTVPGHQHIPIADQFPLPEPLPEKPAHWEEMLQIASTLSKPFDFVRVDLYDLPDGVYFSEFTFSPNASAFPFSDAVFSRDLLKRVLGKTSRGGSQ